MTKASDNAFPSVLITEGTEPSAPAAGKQRLYIDSTTHHLKRTDSSGTDVDIETAASGAPSTAEYVTTAANGTLSNEIVRPELGETSSGSDVDMSGATSGTGITPSSVGGMTLLTYTDNSFQFWDVASAIGTGNFDVRLRITDLSPLDISAGVSAGPLFALSLADSSRTVSTALTVLCNAQNGGTADSQVSGRVNNVVQGDTLSNVQFPLVLRMTRVTTTVTYYVSTTGGRTWTKLGTSTSSLNIAKIGAMVHNNSGGTGQALVHWIRA